MGSETMDESLPIRFEFRVDFKSVKHIATKRQAPPSHSRLCQSLVLAHQLQSLLSTGEIGKTRQANEWLNITKSRLSQILILRLLSPRIQEEILFSSYQDLEGVAEKAVREIAVKVDWEDQWRSWTKLQTKVRKEKINADTEVL